MPMKPCDQCLESLWDFEPLPDYYVRATCQMCGHEVEFQTKRPVKEEGDPCRHCKVPVKKHGGKFLNGKRRKKAFHYCYWLKCPNCRRAYMLDKYKTYQGQDCDCPKPDYVD